MADSYSVSFLSFDRFHREWRWSTDYFTRTREAAIERARDLAPWLERRDGHEGRKFRVAIEEEDGSQHYLDGTPVPPPALGFTTAEVIVRAAPGYKPDEHYIGPRKGA